MDKAILLTDDPVYKVGRNPLEIGHKELKKAGIEPCSPMEAIRARCIDCSNTAHEVARCTAVACPLWPFRMGASPFRATRVMTEDQRTVLVERLKGARAAKASQVS